MITKELDSFKNAQENTARLIVTSIFKLIDKWFQKPQDGRRIGNQWWLGVH